MWYACWENICTIRFTRKNHLLKHIEANIIEYNLLEDEMTVYQDGVEHDTIDFDNFPIKTSRLTWVIFIIGIVVITLGLAIWWIVSL